MVWNEVAFETLVKIADSDQESALNNTLIRDAVLNGHVALQVLAIRRLTDTTRNVISLSRLLQDIRKHRKLLTRENYVAFDGLPYEPASVEDPYFPTLGSGPNWLATTGPHAFSSAQRAHERFDQLSGVRSNERKREDCLPVRLLDTIEGWVESCDAKGIAKWSHSYIAHAGSQTRREEIAGFSMQGHKVSIAIKGLARAAEGISAYILYSSGRMNALMPTPQLDQFEHLKNAVLSGKNEVDPHEVWNSLAFEYDGALGEVGEDLISSAGTS